MRGLAADVLSAAWSRATKVAACFAPPRVRIEGLTVVSVGSIAAGGAGRTPLALGVAAALRARGAKVAVVSRGYRGTGSTRGALVSDGRDVLVGAREAGDEALLAARRLPGVMVRVDANRVRAALRVRAMGAEIAVLDDGFQNLRLHRDLDVVAVDADAAPGRDGVVYREGLDALDRASLVAVRGLRGPTDDPRAFGWDFVPESLVDVDLAVERGPLDLRGLRVVAACAIARPRRFVEVLEGLGARVVASTFSRDHGRVASRGLAAWRRVRADLLVTTEKDLVREPETWRGSGALGLRMAVRPGPGWERLEAALGALV